MKQVKKLNIIVVEDNLFYQQLIAKQLESISEAIHFFTNGEDCLKALAGCKADLIVMDNNLGGEFSGLETLKNVRMEDSNIHVILFSTELGLDTEENIALYGFFEFVEKNNIGFKNLKDTIMKTEVYTESTNF